MDGAGLSGDQPESDLMAVASDPICRPACTPLKCCRRIRAIEGVASVNRARSAHQGMRQRRTRGKGRSAHCRPMMTVSRTPGLRTGGCRASAVREVGCQTIFKGIGIGALRENSSAAVVGMRRVTARAFRRLAHGKLIPAKATCHENNPTLDPIAQGRSSRTVSTPSTGGCVVLSLPASTKYPFRRGPDMQ